MDPATHQPEVFPRQSTSAADPAAAILDQIQTTLGLTSVVSSAAPWQRVVRATDGRHLGLYLADAGGLGGAVLVQLEASGQTAALAQGIIVLREPLDEAQRDRLGLDDLAFPVITCTLAALLAGGAESAGAEPALAHGLSGALAEIRRRILDLTSANVLIALRESRLSVAADETDPVAIMRLLTEDERTLTWSATDEPPVSAGSGLACPLTRERLDARLLLMEQEYRDRIAGRGLNELYLALGTLRWCEAGAEDQMREAPLMLVPLMIQRRRVRRQVTISPGEADFTGPGCVRTVLAYAYDLRWSGEEVRGNPSLALKLEQDFGLALPTFAEVAEAGHEDELPDPARYLATVAASMQARSATAGWSVTRRAVMGFFSYTRAVIEQDLDLARWTAAIPGRQVVEAMLLGSRPVHHAPPSAADIEAAHCTPTQVVIDDCDGSQARALLLADQGCDLVIQGPPGTGKSQTITNLIAQALARGKRVLFVSEKQAALEVVRARLERRGLGAFLLPLHDPRLGVRLLHQAVRRRLDLQAPAPGDHAAAVARIATLRSSLSDWAERMGRTVAHPATTVSRLLWTTSRLRAQVDALRRQPERYLAPFIDRLRADRPTTEPALAQRFFDDLARIELTGLFDRSACWLGLQFLNPPQATCRAIADLLVEASHGLQALATRCSAWEAQGWKAVAITLAEVRAAAATAIALVPPPDLDPQCERLVRLCAGQGDAATLPARTLDLIIQAHRHRESISGLLGQLPSQDWCRAVAPTLTGSNDATVVESAKLRDLQRLHGRIPVALADIARHLLVVNAAATELGLPPVESLSAWQRLGQLLDLVEAAAPGTVAVLEPLHAAAGCASAAATASATIQHLQAERDRLQGMFVWADVPPDHDLAAIRTALRAGHGTWSAWWPASAYHQALRRCRGFLCSPQRLTKEMTTILQGLVDLPAHRQAVVVCATDPALQQALGGLYQGLATDLDFVHQVRALAADLGVLCASVDQAVLLTRLPAWAADRPRLAAARQATHRGLQSLEDLHTDWVAATQGRQWPDTIAELTDLLSAAVRTLHAGAPFWSLPTLPAEATWSDCRQAARERLRLEDVESAIQTGLAALGIPSGSDDPEDLLNAVLTLHHRLGTLPVALKPWILGLPLPLGDAMLQACALGRDLHAVLELLDRKALIPLGELLPLEHRGQIGLNWPDPQMPLATVMANLADCQAQIADLPEWMRLVAITRQAADQPVLKTLTAALLDRSAALSVAEARLLWDWTVAESAVTDRLAADPTVRAFDRVRHEAQRAEFAHADRAQADHAVQHLIATLLQIEVPPGHGRGPVATWTELTLLQHELGKKARHVPVRALVRRAGRALQALLPCWMMSPLSVSWFLPRDGFAFDLVVMDEASQIRPEDALGALMRATQAVIVGDQQQMPPSRTFDAAPVFAGVFAANAMESVLALAESSPRFRSTRLRWHYRSRHQSLIAFSNARFYANDLLIFPSTSRSRHEEGISLLHLPSATYADQCNRIEAEAVVEQVVRHAQANLALPEDQRTSVGVVAMNAPQRALILELLDDRTGYDLPAWTAIDALRRLPEPLLVQNLDNIQGDERDHILISCTYGPEPDTRRLMQRFGPVLQSGGERRLNVLFTRARRRITVITSMRADDIKAGPTSARGLRELKAYLAYAESGVLPDPPAAMPAGQVSDAACIAEIAAALHGLGLQHVSQVGGADSGIDLALFHPDHPERFLLGIACDGHAYHSSQVTRDRDRLRDQVLRDRGWAIHRLWALDWLHHRDHEIARLQQRVRAQLASFKAENTP